MEPFNIKIIQSQYVNTYINKSNIIDIVDCRDMLIGRNYGGSVIELPNGKICRAPYILPYCYPSAKCSISTQDDLAFSVEVWKLNYEFYKNTELKISNIDIYTQILLLYSGFSDETPMHEVCMYHLNYLQSN